MAIPTFGNQAMPSWLSNNSDALLQLGAGLLGGRTQQEQLAGGVGGFAQARQQTKQRNKTLEFLRQSGANDLADAVENGAYDGKSALDLFYKQKLQAQKPRNLSFQTLPDGTYGNYDDQTGVFSPLGKVEKVGEAQQPTSLMRELEAAGLKPGTPEYQQAILANNRPKGMMVESDGQGGFRMVQGADVSGGANLNVEQGKNTGFLLRAQDANQTISGLEGQGTSLWNATAGKLPVVGNYALGADAQKFDQAKRDFVNAVLRQESGAVISPDEFANAERQYFPQPGDSAEVIAQKRQNRENAIAGFRIRSGPGAAAVDQKQGNGQPRRFKFNPATGELE